MANPFDEGIEIDKITKLNNSPSIINEISFSDIAAKLLNENFLLTALELHTELVEAGREVPKLKEFFSNPGNFEHTATRPEIQTSIPRSSSQATLDSLDLTRYSEDGERGVDERVAVLEFELRKAKETISALRANLTVATESETTSPDGTVTLKFPHNEPIKPHEQRALNFLLNEYLLQHGYKLTSITFADENENQDFEDWDDVGLNIPKPAELLNLYRDFMRHSGHVQVPQESASCQTEDLEYLEKDTQLNELILEIENLKDQVLTLEREKQELRQIWSPDSKLRTGDASNTTTPASEMVGMLAENISTHSATPERFEMIDAEPKNNDNPPEELDNRPDIKGDDDESAISLADTDVEWTRLTLPSSDPVVDVIVAPEFTSDPLTESAPCISLSSPISRTVPAAFQREVLSRCFISTAHHQQSQLLDEILNEGISESRLVHILGHSLPRIIPNVILNKREEVIPLIICTIHLHPDAADRDKLLHLLFNLKKRPQEEERRMILAGIVGIARCSGLNLVENEILPQCWEQISHRHVERRLLVAESCSALAPYVSSSIRNSLMLSMLQQMLLEDRDETVREMVVRSLALIVTFMDDKDKYFQCEELAMTALDDPSSSVVSSAVRILMPVLAKWALDIGRLESHLLVRLLQKLKGQTKSTPPSSPNSMSQRKIQENDQRTVYTVTVLQILLPYLLVSIATVEPVLKNIPSDTSGAKEKCFKQNLSLTNPYVFYESDIDIDSVLNAFNICIEDASNDWPQLEWVSSHLLTDLLDVIKGIEVSHEIVVTSFIKFFQEFCSCFGKLFIKQKVKHLFVQRVQHLESAITAMGRGNSCPPLTLIPVYVVGVLAPTEVPGATEELSVVLKRFLCGLAVCGTPLDALEVSVRCLCEEPLLQDTVVSMLWEGVVHPRAVVRVAAASLFVIIIGNVSETLLTARIAPALVTLASDPDIAVRTAVLPALGSLITNTSVKEIQDKTYMQIQSFLSDPSIRENHSMLLQLVGTLGNIVTACDPWFREEVIVPQLAALSSFAEHHSNQTRRIDLASALIEAFSATVYCSLSKHVISSYLLPGLRSLESISCQSLLIHHETLLAMIKGAESRIETQRPFERSGSISLASATANVGQGMEDMKQRVTKIFQKPSMNRPPNLPNLQGIFRKK